MRQEIRALWFQKGTWATSEKATAPWNEALYTQKPVQCMSSTRT
jgi:hypothetical protein